MLLLSLIDRRTIVFVTSVTIGSGGFSTTFSTTGLLVLTKGAVWLMTGAMSLWGERSGVGSLAATRDRDFEIAGVLMVGRTGMGD